MYIAVLHYLKVWLFVTLALVLCGLEAQDAQAEGGGAQAIMSLFVPPNELNLRSQKHPSGLSNSAGNYDPDTHISLREQAKGGITYEVWMEL
ncbi:MAG: hypothetical protein K0Q50_402 [Vampirovibrio sp.]|jgi:hypothetical protein|nr:hypothetical protein [Vampirovibrio sp.]